MVKTVWIIFSETYNVKYLNRYRFNFFFFLKDLPPGGLNSVAPVWNGCFSCAQLGMPYSTPLFWVHFFSYVVSSHFTDSSLLFREHILILISKDRMNGRYSSNISVWPNYYFALNYGWYFGFCHYWLNCAPPCHKFTCRSPNTQ